MQLAVTIRRDDELADLGALIEALRAASPPYEVNVLEAPHGIDYQYPFPVVAVYEGPERGRHFGDDALAVLKMLSIANLAQGEAL